MLEIGREPHHDAARRTDSVTRKEPTKIGDINDVGEILRVDLKAHIQPFRLVHVRARRRVELERGTDTTLRKVDPIHNLLPVGLNFSRDALVKRQAGVALKLKWQPA